MWVEFVGSLLCYERFTPGTQVFPSSQKRTFDLSQIQFNWSELIVINSELPVKEELHCRDVSNTEAELISKHDVDESENVT